jgi:hypothetical protein
VVDPIYFHRSAGYSICIMLEYTSPLFEISVQLLTKKKNKGSDPRHTADE